MKSLYRRTRFAYIREESQVSRQVHALTRILPLSDEERDALHSKIPSHKGQPVGVVAYRIKDGVLEVGASFCNAADTFNKRWGRELATRRLESKPIRADVSHISVDGDSLYKVVHLLAMRLAADNTSVPDVYPRRLNYAVVDPPAERVSPKARWIGSSLHAKRVVAEMAERVQHLDTPLLD
jgi:hypothetical protein